MIKLQMSSQRELDNGDNVYNKSHCLYIFTVNILTFFILAFLWLFLDLFIIYFVLIILVTIPFTSFLLNYDRAPFLTGNVFATVLVNDKT